MLRDVRTRLLPLRDELRREQMAQITDTTTLAELRAMAEPATSRRSGPFGNLYLRPMFFNSAGSVIQGHKHNFDHMTLIARGSVLAEFELPNGEKLERVYAADPHVAEILIKKDVIHKFTALTDEVVAVCVYALRDLETGEVINHWDGGLEAYR